MDPHTFVKVTISKLALRLPVASRPTSSRVHSSCSPCFCEIKVPNNPSKTIPLPLISEGYAYDPSTHKVVTTFYLDKAAFQKRMKRGPWGIRRAKDPCVKIIVYSGKGQNCGFESDKRVGKFCIKIDVKWMASSSNALEVYKGWVTIGKLKAGELHLCVKAETDPRYVFQFDAQPEENPLILQAQGNVHQPIFSCKFSRDRECRSRPNQQEHGIQSWLLEKEKRDRKGWLILIHDLSGSPVAAASMVTPFVPSSGTHHVSHSNPGAWLILIPGQHGGNSWLPVGRLEAWRDHGNKKKIGCNFKLVEEGSRLRDVDNAILLSRTIIKCHKGNGGNVNISIELPIPGGFVMSATTIHDKYTGKSRNSKLKVELAMRHVKCSGDAAIFMALAAAVDLSVDACQPFSRRLSKEFGLSCALG